MDDPISILFNATLFIFAVFLIWTSFFVVKQKTAVVVEFLGKFSFVAKAGLNFKLPLPLMIRTDPISLQLHQMKEEVSVKTKDNAFVTFPISVQYKVIESRIREAYYELSSPVQQISSYVLNVVRTETAMLAMDELYTKKEEIASAVKLELRAKMARFGFEIVTVLVDEPMPSKEVRMAYNRVIAAERERESAVNEAEAIRILKIGEAKAQAESLELTANAYVKQCQIYAQGAKESMEALSVALPTLSAQEVLQYLADMDHRDMLREASKGPGTILIPQTNTSNLSESIALLESKSQTTDLNLREMA